MLHSQEAARKKVEDMEKKVKEEAEKLVSVVFVPHWIQLIMDTLRPAKSGMILLLYRGCPLKLYFHGPVVSFKRGSTVVLKVVFLKGTTA